MIWQTIKCCNITHCRHGFDLNFWPRFLKNRNLLILNNNLTWFSKLQCWSIWFYRRLLISFNMIKWEKIGNSWFSIFKGWCYSRQLYEASKVQGDKEHLRRRTRWLVGQRICSERFRYVNGHSIPLSKAMQHGFFFLVLIFAKFVGCYANICHSRLEKSVPQKNDSAKFPTFRAIKKYQEVYLII